MERKGQLRWVMRKQSDLLFFETSQKCKVIGTCLISPIQYIYHYPVIPVKSRDEMLCLCLLLN